MLLIVVERHMEETGGAEAVLDNGATSLNVTYKPLQIPLSLKGFLSVKNRCAQRNYQPSLPYITSASIY